MDLVGSAKEWVLKNLPYDKADTKLDARLRSLKADDLLIVFHNWRMRQISVRPRRVHTSAAYRANPIHASRGGELIEVEKEIAEGANLKPRLSKLSDAVLSPEGTRLHRRPELDLMLLDWGVHHLHISNIREGDYVKRDGPILFAVIHAEDAYLIDVMTHKDWARDHVIKVLYDEWPDKGMMQKVEGAVGLSRSITEDERLRLRKTGINVMLEVGGHVFMPAGGMTAAGTSLDASRSSDQIILTLRVAQIEWRRNQARVRELYRRQGVILPDKPEFQFDVHEREGVGILEAKTKSFMPLKSMRC